MEKEEIQFKKMTTGSTRKLVVKLGIPTVISMLVTSIYNIADTYFVSGINESTSGAVGVIFPLMAIIQAIGFMFGNGGGSYISSKLGEKKNSDAQCGGASSFYIATAIGILLSIFCVLNIEKLCVLLGATSTVLPYAIDYGFYIVLGFPIMVGSFVMNNILRSEGKSKLAMVGLTLGGIINIILDPLFIKPEFCNLGIKGAAIATLISQFVSYIVLLSMFIFKKSIITLSVKNVSKDFNLYFEIIKIGFPSFCRQSLASLSAMFLNQQAGTLGGDSALSAMTIVSKIFNVIFTLALGIGQGYQPVCGYNYFAKKYDRVKEAFIFTFICSFVVMLIFCFVFYNNSSNIMHLFIDNDEVVKFGSKALRCQCITLPLLCFNVICNMTFQSTRKKVRASLLSSLRNGLFFIPLIFILPIFIGIDGVLMCQSISDFLTFVVSLPFFIKIIISLSKMSKDDNTIKSI